MNKRTMILLVAMVATILPAVAVAEVMVQGNISVESTVGSPAFYAQPGSNYAAAQGLMPSDTSIWASIADSPSEIIGTLTLPTMTNETVWGVNIIDVNFTSSIVSGNFFINISVSTAFSSGSYLYISESPMTLSSLSGATPLTGTTTIGSSGVVYSASLTSTVTLSLEYTGVSHGTTIYFGFETSPNGLGTAPGAAEIAMNFMS